MKVKNIILAIRDQGPLSRLARNLAKGHLLGLVSKRSHVREGGSVKIPYSTRPKAEAAAVAMEAKTSHRFSIYKCLYCDGFHIGKNADRQEGSNALDTRFRPPSSG